MNRHLNEDQLLHRLYGLAENDSHLDDCPECTARLEAMELRRADSSALASEAQDRISGEFLAQQRRAIYARMENPAPARVHWAPALAAATLLAVGIFLYRPSHPAPAQAPRPELSEEQLFSEVFSMEQAPEPRVAAPIRSLFEDRETAEEQ